MAETAPGQSSLPFSQEDEVGMLRSTVRHLEDENARLREIIARLAHKEFGSASERSVNGVLDMVVDEPPTPDAPAPDEVMAGPDAYMLLEEKEVQTSRSLELVPAHAVLHVYHRRAYVRRDGRGAPLRAAAPQASCPAARAGGV